MQISYGVIKIISPSWTNYKFYRIKPRRPFLTFHIYLHSSSTEALNKLHWHPLIHRRHLHQILTIYKLKNNLTSEFNFEQPKTNHLYNTRQKDDIYLSKPKTNWGKQKLLYQARKEYNALDSHIRSIKQFPTFKNKLFKSLNPQC